MQLLLVVQSAGEAVKECATHQGAEDCNDDGVGLGTAALRFIKPCGAVIDAVGSHERTRERAHAQQYAVLGMPRQRLPLALPFFFTRLGRAVTLATVS